MKQKDKSSIIAYLPDVAVPWAIEERTGRYLYWMLNRYVAAGSDLQAIYPSAAENYSPSADVNLSIDGDIGVLTVDGTLLKHPPPSGYRGPVAPTYGEIEDALTHLASLDYLNRIVLKLSSFGGTSTGLISCMDRIREIAQEKTVIGFISDYACSAGYALVSQCSEVVSSEGAYVGSIGALVVLIDDTKRIEDMGLKLTVVSTGEFKGLGADGSVSKKLEEDQQRICDDIMRAVGARIQSARGLSDEQMETILTGQIWQPAEAASLGLVNSIENFPKYLEVTMNEKQKKQAATETEQGTPEAAPAGGDSQAEIRMLTQRIERLTAENQEFRQTEKDRQAAYQQKECELWVTSMSEAGLVQPSKAPKLTALLVNLAAIETPVTLETIDDAGNVTAETKPLVQHTQEILEDALRHSAPDAGEPFREVTQAKAHQQAETDSNPVAENLRNSGVRMQKNPRLSVNIPESDPNRNQIEQMN